jgi:hypothetical protein
MQKDMGAIPGSREPSPSSTGLGPSGIDPERVAWNDAVEHAAAIAEGLNGWGSRPNPELAHHIAACIRGLLTEERNGA